MDRNGIADDEEMRTWEYLNEFTDSHGVQHWPKFGVAHFW